jgi:pimeloyl-ACP methyl ester carboxylesterase
VFFDAASAELFGVFARPTAGALGVAIIMLSGGAGLPSPWRNRTWVWMARRLAVRGFHSLRFDYHGTGESMGPGEDCLLDRPFLRDLEAAVRFVESNGVHDIVLIGPCFGARTALAGAPTLSRLRGVALIPLPVRDYAPEWVPPRSAPEPHPHPLSTRAAWKGLFDVERFRRYAKRTAGKLHVALQPFARHRDHRSLTQCRGVTPVVVDQLSHLVDHAVPILMVYGTDEPFYADFVEGRAGPLGSVLDRGADLVRISVVEGRVHGLTSTAVQDAVLDEVEQWLDTVVARRARSSVETRDAV